MKAQWIKTDDSPISQRWALKGKRSYASIVFLTLSRVYVFEVTFGASSGNYKSLSAAKKGAVRALKNHAIDVKQAMMEIEQ